LSRSILWNFGFFIPRQISAGETGSVQNGKQCVSHSFEQGCGCLQCGDLLQNSFFHLLQFFLCYTVLTEASFFC